MQLVPSFTTTPGARYVRDHQFASRLSRPIWLVVEEKTGIPQVEIIRKIHTLVSKPANVPHENPDHQLGRLLAVHSNIR